MERLTKISSDATRALGSLYLGSCGWAFEDWRSAFYPEHLPHSQWLSYYSAHFNAIEVDSTFYQIPSAHTIINWRDKTPADFRFCLRLPRLITHERPLGEADKELHTFIQAVEPLGEKLGFLLAQFPTSLHSHHHYKSLTRWIANLPASPRFAIEFRHPSWNAARYTDLLASKKIVRVWNDTTPPGSFRAYISQPRTSDEIYIRLLGDTSTGYAPADQRHQIYTGLQWPRDSELDVWAQRISQTAFTQMFIFANNHFEGFSPETVVRLRQRLGLPPRNLSFDQIPHSIDPTQGELW